jgi:hypothetical protein
MPALFDSLLDLIGHRGHRENKIALAENAGTPGKDDDGVFALIFSPRPGVLSERTFF